MTPVHHHGMAEAANACQHWIHASAAWRPQLTPKPLPAVQVDAADAQPQSELHPEAETGADWLRNVRFGIDRHGQIAALEVGVAAQPGDTRVAVLMPGIPNLHSHTFQRAIIGRTERSGPGGEDFWTWRARMYQAALSLSPGAFEAVAYHCFVEMLEAGYTTVCEFHYVHQDVDGRPYADPAELSTRVIIAAQRAGIRLCLLPVLYLHAGLGAQGPRPAREDQRRFVMAFDAYLHLVESLRTRARTGEAGTFSVGLAPHSLRAVDVVSLRHLAQWRDATDPALPLHIHVSEQVAEVEEIQTFAGATPIDLLADTVSLDPWCCLVHATHATPRELQRMAQSGATVALCPTTEANLGDGVFPLPAAQAQRLRFGIGSDSQVARNPWAELRLMEYAQRLQLRRRCVAAGPGQSTGAQLYAAAVADKAPVTGWNIGRLAVGAMADFIALDEEMMERLARTTIATSEEQLDELIDTLVFDESAARMLDVYVGGELVVERGRHLRR